MGGSVESNQHMRFKMRAVSRLSSHQPVNGGIAARWARLKGLEERAQEEHRGNDNLPAQCVVFVCSCLYMRHKSGAMRANIPMHFFHVIIINSRAKWHSGPPHESLINSLLLVTPQRDNARRVWMWFMHCSITHHTLCSLHIARLLHM